MRRATTLTLLLAVVLAGCSGSSEPTATYTGDACNYDGPSEFDVDTTVTFTVTNESETTDVGFAIWRFPSGVTPDEIYSKGIFQAVGAGDNFASLLEAPSRVGEPRDLRVSLDTTGQWGINCFDLSGADTEADYTTMFTVNE